MDWFEWYSDRCENRSVNIGQVEGVIHRCPCCQSKTLTERGGYDICPVCFWEDDGQDDEDADMVRAGPNGGLSLTEARANYRQYKACERRFVGSVRPSHRDEE